MEALRDSSQERYEIVEQIGQGSMGAVYLARDLTTGEEVALKTLNEAGSLDDADLDRLRRLFLNEASAGSLLSHPGIVKVRDLVDEPGKSNVFLVMDYVSGSSLAELLARPDPLPFDFVVTVINEVAGVLDHVHAHGVVHRDIKPANILINDESGIRVTDFGISELRGHDLAAELQRAGSPNYMAPERVLGTGTDYRADIWALGVVLYEMLTRRLPFQGESVAELVTKIAGDEPSPLDEHSTTRIPGLQPIVDKALAKEPHDRYQFAGELATELKQIQAGQMQLSATLPAESIPEPGVEPAESAAEEPAWKASIKSILSPLWGVLRRRRLVTALSLVTVVLGSIWLGAGSEPAAREEIRPRVGEEQRQRFEYLALLEQARQLLERGEHEAAAGLFARAEALSPDAGRIRALRDGARQQAEREVEAEVALEVAALVGIGESDLAEGRLSSAATAAARALEMSGDDQDALALAAAVESARRVARARVEEARRKVAIVQAPLPPPAPEPAEKLRVEEPIRPPVAAPAPTHSDLKVDFYSELPRGVVTVYRAESQILRRPFRFVEKKRFMRTRGVSGGFDEQVRVKAGPSDFRVYLSLPNRETQVQRLSGILPAGAIRALQVRVDAEGVMSVTLH